MANDEIEAEELNGSETNGSLIAVGIGASAGGIKALKEFFAAMPSDSGMAFVVVLHLSPTHESTLAEILQKETRMPVTQVNEKVDLKPNQVYVIPPNKNLAMMDGSIALTELGTQKGSRIAIDLFFRTLANAYGRNGVCVVLSGTGTDGTIGLKRIKESNGFAIVQDPDDAEYDGMPRSAISTNLVDWVLPVSEMPSRLLRFKASSEKLRLTENHEAVAPNLKGLESLPEIITLLRIRTGHDFSHYKKATLLRRIARHLQIYDLDDINEYIKLLRDRPEDLQSLLKNLLINVTNFFRDKDAFFELEKSVIPALFNGKKPSDTIRIWSVGCASGEEAYSLGILLSERAAMIADPPKIQVFATDVDDDAIAEARENRYPVAIEADVSPERLKRFFNLEGDHYTVKKSLRELILFAPHNILRDPPFSRLDLIVCRNVMIYLNKDAQERVLKIFHFALNPGGFLFLGNSESAEGHTTAFTTVNKKHRIYSSRSTTSGRKTAPQLPDHGNWLATLPEGSHGKVPERAASVGEIHYKLVEKYAPPSILVNEDFEIVHISESASQYLRYPGGEPTNMLFKAVHPDLLPDLRAALYATQREKTTSEFPDVKINIEGDERFINIVVRNVEIAEAGRDFLLVTFEEVKLPPAPVLETKIQLDKNEALETVARRLDDELRRTKDRLRMTIEQHETSIEELKATNEELLAANEELTSATEELETSKEELQSVNEELTTVNHELKDSVDELSRTNSDLQNLMTVTDIGTIFLDRMLQIKRFTPSVQKIFNVIATDVGRPLRHLTHKLDYQGLNEDAETVLRTLVPLEDEVADTEGHMYLMRLVPYRTTEDKIEGIVITFIDITDREHAEANLREANERFRVIVNAATTGVIQTDLEGNIIFANQQFCELTGYSHQEILRRTIWDITFTDDVERIRKLFNKMASDGMPFEIEKRYIRMDGSVIWVHNSVTVVRDRYDRPQSAIAIVLNINDRKLREEEKNSSQN